MRKLSVQGKSGKSTILVGEILDAVSAYVNADHSIIITDQNVKNAWGHAFPPWPIITIGSGEEIKTLKTVEDIYTSLLELEADRSTFIVGIGGGVVCDVTGFVGATYLRGLRFGFVASTLLAQVDASVGGKNGVNLQGFKNMIGTFRQPEFVLCDLKLLKTLPFQHFSCGFAEMVKHAVIHDAAQFDLLESESARLYRLDLPLLEKRVHESVAIKARIVSRDEHEKGERRKLNFGHTLGHAFEKQLKLPHGEAVALGMIAALRLSHLRGMIENEVIIKVTALLEALNLPVQLPQNIDIAAISEAVRQDKKRVSDKIKFVLLEAIGRAVVEDIRIEELSRVIPGMIAS